MNPGLALVEIINPASGIQTAADLLEAVHNTPYMPTCDWKQDEDGNWNMECGDMFILSEGWPSSHRMNFCCGCGRKLVEIPFTPEEK